MGIQINGQTDTVTAIDGSINVGGNVTIPGVLTYEDVTNVDSVGVVTARDGIHVTGGSVGIGTDAPGMPLEVLTNNSTLGIRINRYHSGSYYSDIIHTTSPEGLAFRIGDGSTVTEKLRITSGGNIGIGTAVPATKLNVIGDTRVEGYSNAKIQIKRTGNTVANGSIEFLGSDDSFGWGLIANYDAGGSNFNIKEGSNSRLYIKSGNIGIGTNNPTTTLEVKGDITVYNSNNQGDIFFGEHGDVSDSKALIRMDQVNSTTGQLQFYTEGSGTLTERLRITSTGAIGIGSNFTAIETTGGGGITLDSGSGGGNIGVFLKSTGYTGNQTKLWQDSANAVSYLEATERPLIIKAGDGTGDYLRMDVAGSERLRLTAEGYPWIQNKKTTSFTNNSTVTILTIGDHTNAVVKFILHVSDGGYRQHEWAGEYTAFVSNANGSPGVSYYLKEHWQDFGSGNWNSPVVTVSINSSGQVQFNATNSNSDANGTVDVVVLSVTSTDDAIPTIS